MPELLFFSAARGTLKIVYCELSCCEANACFCFGSAGVSTGAVELIKGGLSIGSARYKTPPGICACAI